MMYYVAKIFGTLIVEIDVDGTLSTYYRLWDRDYEVSYSLNELTDYRM